MNARRWLLIAGLVLLPALASAQVAVDAVTTDGEFFGSSDTFSHTVSGSNRYLIVTCWVASNTESVSAVSYNAVALSLLGYAKDINSDAERVEAWGLVAPATGSNTVSVTMSNATTAFCAAASFTAVDQTTPVGTTVADWRTADGISHSHSTSGQTNGLVWDAFQVPTGAGTITPSGSQTTRVSATAYNGGVRTGIATTEAGAATVSTGYAWVNDFYIWAHVTVPLSPVGGASSARGRALVLGVGK